MRYSTARSGLLKLARIARITSSLGKPIPSAIVSMVLWSAGPDKKELGSPKAAEAVVD